MNTIISQHKVDDFNILKDNFISLTISEKVILGCILNYSLTFREVFPSINTIATNTGKSIRTVKRAIKKLAALNFFRVIKKSGWNTHNFYKINFRLKMKKFGLKMAELVAPFWSHLPENVTLINIYKCKYKIKEVLGSKEMSASKKVRIFQAQKIQDEEYVDTQLKGWCTDLIEYWKGLLAAKTSRFLTKKEKGFAKMIYPEKEAQEFNGVVYSSKTEQPIDVNMLELFYKTEQAEIGQCKEEIAIKEHEVHVLREQSGISDLEKRLVELNKAKYNLFVGIIGKTLPLSAKEKYNEEIRSIEKEQKELEAQKSILSKKLESASINLQEAEKNLAMVKFEAKERRLRDGVGSFVG